jgi:hypothetical protein
MCVAMAWPIISPDLNPRPYVCVAMAWPARSPDLNPPALHVRGNGMARNITWLKSAAVCVRGSGMARKITWLKSTDFYVCGERKSVMYVTVVHNVAELQQNVRRWMRVTLELMCATAVILRRWGRCVAHQGQRLSVPCNLLSKQNP